MSTSCIDSFQWDYRSLVLRYLFSSWCIFIPGDAALAILGERATEKALTELRHQMGLDQPLYKQYGVFLWDLVHLDLGRSFKTNQPVIDEILRKFPATVELTLAAMSFSIFFGMAAGIIAAVNRGKFWDYTTMFGSLAGISMPIFWLGLMLILLLAYTFPIFSKLTTARRCIRSRHSAPYSLLSD